MTGECPFRDSGGGGGGGGMPPPSPSLPAGEWGPDEGTPPIAGGRASTQTLGTLPSGLPPEAWLQVILEEGLQFKVTVPFHPPES